jgi:hypothetical protein
MQGILDNRQSDEQDELNKVSLERLAVININLLIKIKQTAEDTIKSGGGGTAGWNHRAGGGQGDPSTPAAAGRHDGSTPNGLEFLLETRTVGTIEIGKTWERLNLDLGKRTPTT